MPQFAMPETSTPAFVVVEVDSFPGSAPEGSAGSVRWNGSGHAVIYIRRDLSLSKKLGALQWGADQLQQRLTPDKTGYWDGLKLVSENGAPEPFGSGHLVARPALSVAR